MGKTVPFLKSVSLDSREKYRPNNQCEALRRQVQLNGELLRGEISELEGRGGKSVN